MATYVNGAFRHLQASSPRRSSQTSSTAFCPPPRWATAPTGLRLPGSRRRLRLPTAAHMHSCCRRATPARIQKFRAASTERLSGAALIRCALLTLAAPATARCTSGCYRSLIAAPCTAKLKGERRNVGQHMANAMAVNQWEVVLIWRQAGLKRAPTENGACQPGAVLFKNQCIQGMECICKSWPLGLSIEVISHADEMLGKRGATVCAQRLAFVGQN